MSVRKTKDGKYECRYDTYDASGIRKQHRRRFKLKRDADEFDAAQKVSGKEESKLTVKEYLDSWLSHVKRVRKPSTYELYRHTIEVVFLPRFDGRIRLDRCKRIHIQAVLDKLADEGKAKSTLLCVRRIISAAFNQAVADETIDRNPAKHCDAGGKASGSVTVLDSAQVTALLNEARNTEAYLAIFLGVTMALSRGEVAALKWADIDFAHSVLTVRSLRQYTDRVGVHEGTPKTANRTRTLPMPIFVSEVLQYERKRQLANQMMMGNQYHRSDYVVRMVDGKVYHPGSLSLPLKTALQRAGLPPMRFHWLRHSCASLLLDKGVPLTVVSEILGHGSTAITAKVYSHAIASSKGIAAKVMQDTFGQKK